MHTNSTEITDQSDFMHPESPFYVAVNHNHKENSHWFKNQPLGEKSLGKMMKVMAKKAKSLWVK